MILHLTLYLPSDSMLAGVLAEYKPSHLTLRSFSSFPSLSRLQSALTTSVRTGGLGGVFIGTVS